MSLASTFTLVLVASCGLADPLPEDFPVISKSLAGDSIWSADDRQLVHSAIGDFYNDTTALESPLLLDARTTYVDLFDAIRTHSATKIHHFCNHDAYIDILSPLENREIHSLVGSQLSEMDLEARIAALRLLTQLMPNAETGRLLLKSLADKPASTQEQFHLIWALGRHGKLVDGAGRVLEGIVEDPGFHKAVRLAACLSLAKTSGDQYAEKLVTLSGDEAFGFVASLGCNDLTGASFPSLLLLAMDSSREIAIRLKAVDAIEHIGWARCVSESGYNPIPGLRKLSFENAEDRAVHKRLLQLSNSK